MQLALQHKISYLIKPELCRVVWAYERRLRKEEDLASENDFCVTFQGPEEGVFSMLEADLEKEE